MAYRESVQRLFRMGSRGLVSGSSRRVVLRHCPLLGLALGVDEDKEPVLNSLGLMPGRKRSPDR